MNRIVYLFELDSAKKFNLKDNNTIYETDGVRSMLHEIINNGNTVAVSMNQLADSQFFAQAVYNDFTYPILCKLFESGALRVSLFKDIRTASQYIQNAIQKCLDENDDSFVFSNLSVSYHDKKLLLIIQNALKNSDLSKLQELRDKSTDEEKQKYEHICRYIKMILDLSTSETGNIPPKAVPSKDFEFFLETITTILHEHTFSDIDFDKKIKDAIQEIHRRSPQVTEKRHNRSNWLYLKDGTPALSFLAAEIINLCYNYTIEDSVNGISKHYNEDDYSGSFAVDLISRTEKLRSENENKKLKPLSKRKWKMALRFAEYRQSHKAAVSGRYEENFSTECRKWKFQVFRKALIASAWALIYLAIFLITELLIQQIENLLTLPYSNLLVSSILSIIIVGFIAALINLILSKINKHRNMPDILESIFDILLRMHDLTCVIFGGKNDKRNQP